MNLENRKKALKNLGINPPEIIIELMASQIGIAEEARDRIKKEGIVVRDMKGSVVAHPAIKIEQDALKNIEILINKKRKKHR